MNYSLILEHAFDVTARRRALWILGFLWAVVGGCGGGPGGTSGYTYGGGRGGNRPAGQVPEALRRFGERLSEVSPERWIGLAMGLACVALVLAVVFTIARYVLQAGIFRSLDQLDADGREPTVRGSWREGWHRRTWRPFLQNVGVNILFAVAAILALLPVLVPAIAAAAATGARGWTPVTVLGGVGAGCYCCLWLIALFVAANVVGVLKQLWWRAALLDDRDLIAAMEDGWRLARANPRPLLGMWLVMFVVGIVWGLVTVGLVVGFGLLTALLAGGPAWLIYRATQGLAWPLVWGVPVGILTFAVPLLLAAGLYMVFQASVWTQVYRALAGPAAVVDRP
jgi:hypothetical protein